MQNPPASSLNPPAAAASTQSTTPAPASAPAAAPAPASTALAAPPQPSNLKPKNPQTQPIRPTPPPSQPPLNRAPSQNTGGQHAPPAPSHQASSTSGLLDRTGDKPRSGPLPPAGTNPNGSAGGPGQGPNQIAGGPGFRPGPGPGPGSGPGGATGPGGMGHPNRPTNITIPSAFPIVPNSGGQTPNHPPNSALNTPAASTANTPTGPSTVAGHNPSQAGPSTFSRTTQGHSSSSTSASSSSAPTRMIGQNDRSVVGQGRLFAEPLAREHARTQIERAGLKPSLDVKGMVMADRAVEGMLASIMRSATRIKDHRVAYTNPRPAPFWPGSGSIAKKEGKDGMEVDAGEDRQEVPMWKVDVLDDPRKDIFAAHAAIEESERAKKSTRVIERSEWDRRKQAEAEGRTLQPDDQSAGDDGMQVDGPLSGSTLPSNLAASGPSTPGPSTPGLVAPDSMAETPAAKKKTGKKNPQQEQDLAARRAQEAQKKETARALAAVMGGSKKYSWMSGGGGGTPKTPLGSRLGVGGLGSGGKYKRANILDGKIKIDSGASSPSTPGPAGMRGNKRTFEGTPLNAAKRAKKGSGLMNDSTTAMLAAPSKPNPYEFVKVDDKLDASDVLVAFRREVMRGGPNKVMYEKKYFELMVQMAETAHEDWKKENAGLGGSTIAGGTALD